MIIAPAAHELADCLWSVLTLAAAYDVDLERAFTDTMSEIKDSIEGVAPSGGSASG